MVRRNIALQSTALTFVIQPSNGSRRFAFAENSPAPSEFVQGDVTERAVPAHYFWS